MICAESQQEEIANVDEWISAPVIPPWRSSRLVDWWEMNEFQLDKLQVVYALMAHINAMYKPVESVGDAMFSQPQSFNLSEQQRMGIAQSLALIADALRTVGLENAAQAARDIQPQVTATRHGIRFTNQNAVDRMDEVERAIRREMKGNVFFYVDRAKADFYRDANLFGPEVEKRFPGLSGDISEAGKCLALDRPTACVFHLMRVMEAAVQEFGGSLGVSLPQDKNWQVILDQTNKAIKAMDSKDPKTRQYAEASAHLFSVKLAWRNAVMHPKDTYTTDEAKAIFDNVKTFLSDLAVLI